MRRAIRMALLILALALLIAHVGGACVLAKPTPKPTPKPRTSDPDKPDAPDTPVPQDKPTAPATPAPQKRKPTPPPTPTPVEPTAVPPTPVPPTPIPSPTATVAPTETSTPTPAPEPLIISGRVFDDRDGDGRQGPGETGVSGVPITVDDAVVAATDNAGYFQVAVPAGRARLAIVPPAGWDWQGQARLASEAAGGGGFAIAVQRTQPAGAAPSAPATVATGGVVLAALVAGLGFLGVSGLIQSAAIRGLERTYRRQKSLELEQLQAQAIDARRREMAQLLASEEDGWQTVIDQLLVDADRQSVAALPHGSERAGRLSLLDISMVPVPRFTVAGPGDVTYLFTTSPRALRQIHILSRKHKAVALDASLHPAARVEVQAVWDHLAARRLPGQGTAALPRQAAWFLVARPVGGRKRGTRSTTPG
jgi:hypothetical protein